MTIQQRVRIASYQPGSLTQRHCQRVLPSVYGLIATAVLGAFIAIGLAGCRDTSKSVPLPGLGAAINLTSVSGISSGAYMAGQFQLTQGELVVGAGIIAGGPYGCAESIFAGLMPGPGSAMINATKAINGCMLNAMQIWGVPNPPALVDRARRLAQTQAIAPIEATLSDRIYLFTGKSDHTVAPPIVAAAASFYSILGVPQNQIKFVTGINAGHAFVTENQGAACDVTAKPYVVDCDYDQAGDLLSFIYTNMNPPVANPEGSYVVFDQRPFTNDLSTHGMDDAGVVYVPRSCQGLTDRATPGAAPNTQQPPPKRLPRTYRFPRLRPEPRSRRRRLCPPHRIRALGRQQPLDHPFSTSCGKRAQPAGLLGLVGIYGPRISHAQGTPDHCCPAHAGPIDHAGHLVMRF